MKVQTGPRRDHRTLVERPSEPSGPRHGRPGVRPGTVANGRWTADVDTHIVGIAVGLLIGRRRCSPHRGFGVLVDLATRTGRSVTDEAHHLVAAYQPTRVSHRAGDGLSTDRPAS